MQRVVLGVAAVEQLRTIRSSTELCDADGNVVGVFTPTSGVSEYAIEQPPTDEELNRIDRGFQGRPLDDILQQLQSRS